MADSGIKKVIIPKEKLGIINSKNEYIVRYRVVSNDKNRASYWSPNYVVISNYIEDVDGDVTINNNTITVTWDNSLQRPEFDIFVSFNSALDKDLKWKGTATGNTYSFLKTGTLPVRVVVQVRSIGVLDAGSFVRSYDPDLAIYDSGQVSS